MSSLTQALRFARSTRTLLTHTRASCLKSSTPPVSSSSFARCLGWTSNGFRHSTASNIWAQDDQKSRFEFDSKLLSTSPFSNARAKTARSKSRPWELVKPTQEEEERHADERKRQRHQEQFAPAPQRDPQDQSMDARLDRSQLQTLEDKGTRQHLAKVYGTTASTIGVAGLTTATSLGLGIVAPFWIGMVGIVPLIGFYMTDINTSPAIRGGLLATFTGLSGLSLTPLVGLALAVDPMVIPLALGGTAAIMAGSSAAALLAPRASMLKFAPILGGGVAVLFGCFAVGMVQMSMTGAVSPLLTGVSLYGGFALAIAFTAFDTQNIIEEYRSGNADYLRHSVDMFVNFLMIFKRLLFMLLNRD